MPAPPIVTYKQIRDPSVALPGIPGVMDPVLRTIQALAIAALKITPLLYADPPILHQPGSGNWRTLTQTQKALPEEPVLSRLNRCFAAVALISGPGGY